MNIQNNFINLTDPVIFQSFGGEKFWERVDFNSGDTILEEGEESQDFYYIFSGSVKVTKSLKDSEKTQKQLATLMTGDFFGEGALLSDKSRGATVHAMAKTVLLKLSLANFQKLVQSDAQAAVGIVLGIVKVLNLRLQNMNERLVTLYNVGKYAHSTQVDQMIPGIFKDLVKAIEGGQFVLFGMDGLPQYQSEGIDEVTLNNFKVQIPDVANKLAVPGAPLSYTDENRAYCAVHNLKGELLAVLAAIINDATQDQDIQLLVTVSEQLGAML